MKCNLDLNSPKDASPFLAKNRIDSTQPPEVASFAVWLINEAGPSEIQWVLSARVNETFTSQ